MKVDLKQINSSKLFSIASPFLLFFLMLLTATAYGDVSKTDDEVSKDQQQISTELPAWLRLQLPIFGLHTICPEADCLNALSADTPPVDLQTARPLFNPTEKKRKYWFLDEVMASLAKQCPDYRKYLTHIYLPQELYDEDDYLQDAIFERWDLKAEPLKNMSKNINDIALSLVLVARHNDRLYPDHGRFISATLMGSENLITKTGLPAKAWMGTMMNSELPSLPADIEEFNNGLKKEKLKDIWIAGLGEQNDLTAVKDELSINGNSEVVFHDIDLSLGKNITLAYYFNQAIAAEAAIRYLRPQLMINHDNDKLYLQLMSPEKLK